MRNFEKIKKNTKKNFLSQKKFFFGQKKYFFFGQKKFFWSKRGGIAYGRTLGCRADFARISWDCVRDGVRIAYGGTRDVRGMYAGMSYGFRT